MQLGVVGLGRMGGNIVRRLLRTKAHDIVAFDSDTGVVKTLAAEGARAANDLPHLVSQLAKPRVIWVMLPAGSATEETITALGGLLEPNDILIDGGNTFWQDDIRRAQSLNSHGIHYVDVGTSGGIHGLERGYCLMIGGDDITVKHLDPLFAALAPGMGNVVSAPERKVRDPRVAEGYLHAGPVGAGHFVKMVHNGIEYGLMQAYAEGFDILKNADSTALPEAHRFQFDLADVAEVWRRGSVIPSWLLDLIAASLARDGRLENYSGIVDDSGEGRWAIHAAIAEAVPTPVLTAALFARFRSRQDQTFADKILSAMRDGFGGHKEPDAT